jgi:hypothetical protein
VAAGFVRRLVFLRNTVAAREAVPAVTPCAFVSARKTAFPPDLQHSR